MQTRVVRHTAGEMFDFDGVRVRVLAPEASYRPGPVPGNNDSLVLQLSWEGKSALLEGDAESPSEERMVAEGGLHADFLKVGHHGSRTSTTPDFLAAVAPEWAAISVGRRNFYGHPNHEVLERLERRMCGRIARTCWDCRRLIWMGGACGLLFGRRVSRRPVARQPEPGAGADS